ncbi:magnesium transporter [Acholeplasma equirhinis]|uniref:magnesium transporter n=1 Tax=Acholeplasma equirhinis TaxID=555393 RepID=UPI00197B0254|nr:magnesium transporter [Acholeplasma equirhinis]MBN3490048.1 magnesium transporter [Acholeplasma equirhinis]
MLKTLLDSQASKEEILKVLEDTHAYDLAKMFSELSEDEQEKIFSFLDSDKVAEILAYLNPVDAADLFQTLSIEEQKEVVEELEPDDAADIINELPDEDRVELIKVLDQDEDVLSLINYEEFTAGSYMTNEFLVVKESDDVKDATKKVIKDADFASSIQTIFVVDDNNHYVGQVTLKDLIKSRSPKVISEIMEIEPTVLVTDEVDTLVKHMKHYGGYDLAVLDETGTLLGAITMDDILDIYKEEAIEDLEKLSALPDTDFNENLFKSAFHRLPWLIILMLLSLPIAFVTSQFEEILASVVILALFQPLILDSGGDVASQTLAVTLISLTQKDSKPAKNGFKEIISGMMSGFVMGLLAFVATVAVGYIMGLDHIYAISFVVGGALFITVALAPILGFLVPYILKLLKLDPAVASGPFITTMIDIISVIVYFGLATLVLGGVING